MTRRPVQLALPLDVPPLPAGVRSELKAQIVPGWAQRAACASTSVDPDWWHAPPGDDAEDVARGICAGCPVRRSCLAHALAVGEPDGIWGGLDDAERTWVRVALAEGSAVAAVLGPVHGQAAA
jgi:WhiB family transcriptional regulator, redox-sensing transcriptional regulator